MKEKTTDDRQSRTDELGARRSDLVNEKSRNIQRLAEINSTVKARLPKREFLALMDERSKLVSDNADIDAEIRDTNEELGILARSQFKGGEKKERPLANLGLVVTIVSAYRASGDQRNIKVLTNNALEELDEIRSILESRSENQIEG